VAVVANVAVNLDARNATQNAARFKKEMDGAANSIKRTDRAAATATANIQRFGIAFRSVVGPLVAVTGAVTLLSRSLNVLGERQADAAALENGLKKLGGRSADLIRLQAVADKLGKQTLFNQEDFDRGFALLTSFQSIAVGSYERVAKAAADVAQITKQDVNSSLLQLAKALQDPEKGLTALARSGTQFSETQKKLIKELVASGDLLKAQDFILQEIEKQYGNAAAAAGSAGYAGAVDSLQESFRDFQERLAKGVEPAVIGTAKALTDLFDIVNKIPAPVGNAALAVGGVTAAVIALRAAIVALLPVAKALLAFVIANPWFALAAGITAAAVALSGYRREAQKIAESARTGGAAEVVAARGKLSETEANISLKKRAREETSDPRERAQLNRDLATLRKDAQELRDAIKSNEADIETVFKDPALDTAFDGAADGAKKIKDELQKSFEKGQQLQIQLQREKELLSASTDIQRKRLQIQYDYQDRAEQIAELKNVEQQINLTIVNDEIRRLELLELQTEEIKEQVKRAKELSDKAIKGADFGVAGEGTVREGIGDAIGKLKDELNPIKLAISTIVQGATAIGDAFSTAFGEVITGSKSVQEALGDAFKKIGEAFISMALEIIAKQMTLIILQTIFNALSGMGGGFQADLDSASKGLSGKGALSSGKMFPTGIFAEGGFVDRPTNALIGEAGEPEYVIPASKMRGAMNRYAAGARGSAVIPSGGGEDGMGGTATAAPAAIDVRYTVERINTVDYVTADQFRSGMQQAAQQGAQQGEQRTLRRLQMSTSTRKRLGM